MLALSIAGCSDDKSPPPATVPSRPVDVLRTIPPATTTTVPATCSRPDPGDYVRTVSRPQGDQHFHVHIPQSAAAEPAPVLFNFHGQGRTAEHQDEYSELPALSDREGFILVTPQGFFGEWNIRGYFGDETVDDVGAVEQMLDALQDEFCIDASRVFATGLSNGAEMASQMGCLLGERFAGIAPVAGIIFEDCEDGPPVAVVTFHGTDDFNIPYELAPPAVAAWALHNGCGETPDEERVAENVLRETYPGCTGAPVVFYTLEGAGHTWPGAQDGAGGVGATNHEISANEVMWAFFEGVGR
jgi:polyhydroxybutyrate depolymerase